MYKQLVTLFWNDVEFRMRNMGVNDSLIIQETTRELFSMFYGLIFAYDEVRHRTRPLFLHLFSVAFCYPCPALKSFWISPAHFRALLATTLFLLERCGGETYLPPFLVRCNVHFSSLP